MIYCICYTTAIVTPVVTPTPAPAVVRKQSPSSKLGWFLSGIAVSLIIGNYKLSQDIWSSAHGIEHVVSSITPDIQQLDSAVSNKLSELEQRISQLEGSDNKQQKHSSR